MKVFFDTEFTGLHQQTTLISIGCIAENGRTFYAELTDFDQRQVNDWLRANVLSGLQYQGHPTNGRGEIRVGVTTAIVGDSDTVAAGLEGWLKDFAWLDRSTKGMQVSGSIEMWSDCLAYDWVLFCELFEGALGIPRCVYYIPFDLATLLKVRGIDPDVNREEFAGMMEGGPKHTALWDAKVIKACYDKITASV